MTISVVPFRAAHAEALKIQQRQRLEMDFAELEYLRALECPEAFSAIEDGSVLACAGLIDWPAWRGQRKTAWAMLGADLGPRRLLFLTRAIRAFLDRCPARRIEMTVDLSFHNAIVWACLLGFAAEGIARGYGPADGRDHGIFARVKMRAPAASTGCPANPGLAAVENQSVQSAFLKPRVDGVGGAAVNAGQQS